jgi:hypothetical protein
MDGRSVNEGMKTENIPERMSILRMIATSAAARAFLRGVFR